MADRQWQGNTDGTPWMHAQLIKALRIIPLPVMYAGAAVFVVPVYMVVNHAGYLSQYHFARQRLKKSVFASFVHVYRNHCAFAQAILDKFYMFGGGKMELKIDNYDLYKQLASGTEGFVILSAHVGNYEIAGYSLVATDKPFNALVYGGEAEMVKKGRLKVFQGHNIRLIPVSQDMSHLFKINNALADGESVSLPADRLFGSSKNIVCSFMGAKAKFPLGPFMVSVQRDVPVLSIHVLKEKTHCYHVYITRLNAGEGNSKERACNLARQFAENLEAIVRKYPTQWYNYYEFWN